MSGGDIFTATGKIAGIGGLSIALAYVILRPIIDGRILKTLKPSERVRILRLTVGCALATSLVGLGVYALTIWNQPATPQESTLSVGRNATVGGSANLNGQTTIGKDLSVGKDLGVGTGQKVEHAH